MYKFIAAVFVFFSCGTNTVKKLTDDDVSKKNYVRDRGNLNFYFVRSSDNGESEEYFQYLGKLDISKRKYNVFNFFKRVQAAKFWHGQSRLLFVSLIDTVSYKLNDNTDFPIEIINDSLFFPQKNSLYHVDSLMESIHSTNPVLQYPI